MLEFRSPIKKEERVQRKERTTIKVEKKAKVTTILFPDNYKQEKNTKVALLELTLNEEDLLLFTEWKEGYPDDSVGSYNVGKNSVNSTPILELLQERFETNKEEFTCEVKEIEDTTLLIVTGVKDIEEIDGEIVDITTGEVLSHSDQVIEQMIEEKIQEEIEVEEIPVF